MSNLSTIDNMQMVQQLPADLMLIKMEGENMMAVGQKKPRDNATVIKMLKKLIDAYPASAHEAIYSKPVGQVFQVRCANEKCKRIFEVAKMDNDTECDRCGSRKFLGS